LWDQYLGTLCSDIDSPDLKDCSDQNYVIDQPTDSVPIERPQVISIILK